MPTDPRPDNPYPLVKHYITCLSNGVQLRCVADFLVAARDVLEYAKIHLPILLGTQVTVSRKQLPRPVNRIH